MRRVCLFAGVLGSLLCLGDFQAKGEKPPLTFDEFFDSVGIRAVKISPDGHAVVIETQRPDWVENRFRSDLWSYRDEASKSGSPVQLAQSGHDSAPEWSPDGKWIAFLSDRKPPGSGDKTSRPVLQLYLIAPAGGEASPVTQGEEDVHAFAWSADSRALFYSTRTPLTKQQRDEYRDEWKDVIRFRESERGDTISLVDVASVIARRADGSKNHGSPAETQVLATTPYRVPAGRLTASPDGHWLAFATDSPSGRIESLDAYGIYLIDLSSGEVRLLSQRQGIYENLKWAPDSRHIFFSIVWGSVEGPYQDAQPRVYWVEVPSGSLRRWAAKFPGAVSGYSVMRSGSLLAAGMLGTEVQTYTQENIDSEFSMRPGWPGTYGGFSIASHSPRVAFSYSSIERPTEIYLAESVDNLKQARAITSFNRVFTERTLPPGIPYRWRADDGAQVEGVLIYPPGKFGARHLRMLTLIHGGPQSWDGNEFGATWYRWAILAAIQGWLIFQPNYRGSYGYGDQFTLGVIHPIVSRPGKDILEGVDALVKDGIADPERLAVGGYSWGGYMTNWLITQTTRFKAAVSGAGAVEHAINWGNEYWTFEASYFLGGPPWEAEKNYNDEAAIWQISKVRTPTHIVVGTEDASVNPSESFLLERALHTLGVPTSLLVFPGEGHGLEKNPWHGKITVREELKWLERYGGRPRPRR